ncbi:hypothetical protein X777_12883 [Ooceraea biroi]|uniref:Uncharacterized protein n=1 Tax=Ooceraea biroi TaxID=2015173 RepID=A0A026VYJ4_OOCBI|nr:hypothetical protein X777_12883 [Ooceraea biroi]
MVAAAAVAATAIGGVVQVGGTGSWNRRVVYGYEGDAVEAEELSVDHPRDHGGDPMVRRWGVRTSTGTAPPSFIQRSGRLVEVVVRAPQPRQLEARAEPLRLGVSELCEKEGQRKRE